MPRSRYWTRRSSRTSRRPRSSSARRARFVGRDHQPRRRRRRGRARVRARPRADAACPRTPTPSSRARPRRPRRCGVLQRRRERVGERPRVSERQRLDQSRNGTSGRRGSRFRVADPEPLPVVPRCGRDTPSRPECALGSQLAADCDCVVASTFTLNLDTTVEAFAAGRDAFAKIAEQLGVDVAQVTVWTWSLRRRPRLGVRGRRGRSPSSSDQSTASAVDSAVAARDPAGEDLGGEADVGGVVLSGEPDTRILATPGGARASPTTGGPVISWSRRRRRTWRGSGGRCGSGTRSARGVGARRAGRGRVRLVRVAQVLPESGGGRAQLPGPRLGRGRRPGREPGEVHVDDPVQGGGAVRRDARDGVKEPTPASARFEQGRGGVRAV